MHINLSVKFFFFCPLQKRKSDGAVLRKKWIHLQEFVRLFKNYGHNLLRAADTVTTKTKVIQGILIKVYAYTNKLKRL